MKFSPSLSYAVQRGLLLVGLVHLPNITTYSVGLSALSGFCDVTNIRGQCAERKRQVVLHIVFKQVLKDAPFAYKSIERAVNINMLLDDSLNSFKDIWRYFHTVIITFLVIMSQFLLTVVV